MTNRILLFYFMNGINPMRGGVERVSAILCEELSKRGWITYALSSVDDWENSVYADTFVVPEPYVVSDKNSHYIRNLVLDKSIGCIIGTSLSDARMLGNIELAKTSVPIICHYHNSPRGLYSTISGRYNDLVKRFRWTQKLLFYVQRHRYATQYKRLDQVVDKIVLLSDSYKSEIKLLYEFEDNKLVTINNPNTYRCSQVDFCKKEKKILWVGRMDESSKRISSLLKIWAIASQSLKDWSLTIVGGGDELDIWKNRARVMGLERYEFVGFADPQEYYERASIYIMTSTYEGWPMTLVEAMTYGAAPILFNSFSAASEIVSNGVEGVLIKPFSEKAFANRLINLANDDETRKHMAVKAAEKSTVYSLSSIVDKWEHLLAHV